MLAFSIAGDSFALNIMPKDFPSRKYGFNQYRAQSCMAEAETEALEQAGLNAGYPVKISSWHRHIKNWDGKNSDKPIAEVRAEAAIRSFTSEEQRLFDNTGSIIPKYMLPSGDFRQIYGYGWRPRMSEIGLIDTNFPKDKELGFTRQFYTFEKDENGNDYKNTKRDIQFIINALKRNDAVTLSLHADIFSMMNDVTGLMKSGYKFSMLEKIIKDKATKDWSFIDNNEFINQIKLPVVDTPYYRNNDIKRWSNTNELMADEITHAVAIVGYHDNLLWWRNEDDRGAFIVRNSWNGVNEVAAMHREFRSEDRLQLNYLKRELAASMGDENKINHLTGYYALPARYIKDLINYKWKTNPKRQGIGGFRILTLNYREFMKASERFGKGRVVHEIPFVCGENAYNSLMRNADWADQFFNQGIEVRKHSVKSFIKRHVDIPSIDTSTMRIASIPDDGSRKIINRFFDGEFDNYFCAKHQDDFNPDIEYERSYPNHEYFRSKKVWGAIEGLRFDRFSNIRWATFIKHLSEIK